MASDNELLIKLGVEDSGVAKQIKEVTKELKSLDKQISSVDKSVDGFNRAFSNMEKEADLYLKKMDALETTIELYKKQLNDASKQIDKAKQQMESLGEKTKENRDAWDSATKKLEVAQTKYNNLVRKIAEAETQLEATNQAISKLGEAIEEVKFDKFSKEIEGLEQDLETFDKRINAIDDSTDSFSRNMSAMGEKTELYKGKIDILNKSIEEHKKMLDSTKTNIQNVEHYLDTLGERTEENASEWDKASDCLERYKDRQHDLENSLSGVQSELIETTNEVRNLSSEMAKAPFDELAKGLDSLSTGFGTISQITQPLTTAITGIGTASLATAIDFEQAMAKVQATAGVSSEEMVKLSEKARQIGKDTQLSATEGAEALLLLAQAGYDTEQSLTMVDAVVNLAIANEMGLAEATGIVTSAMNSYGWELERTTEMTDILSSVASASATDVSLVGEAFKAVAPTASALGFEVADVSMVIGLLANNAIQGAEAGNGLKSILSSLVKPTENAQKALNDLGVEIADDKGNMRDLDEIIQDLQVAFSGLSEEEQATIATTIAGKYQMSKFLAIVNSAPEDVNALADAIANSNGKTAEMRDIMEDTASGSWQELLSKLEETAIVIGNELLPTFHDLVDAIGDALEWFQNLDEGTQETIIKFALLTATISPITGVLSSVTGGLSSFASTLGGMAGKIASSSTNIGTLATGFSTLGATVSATGGGSIIGGLSAISTAIAPWLLGGSIAVALGLGIAYIVQNYDTLKDKILGISKDWDYGNSLMEEATRNLAEDVKANFERIKSDIQDFEANGINLLVKGMRTLNEDGTNDFSLFLNSCETEMAKAKSAIETNATEITQALSFMNTDIATVFSFEDLATIQEEWSGQMTRGLETAYNNLETTITEKDAIIKDLMDTHGLDFETAYDTWEAQVLEDYKVFCDALIEAQIGYQEQSLGSLEQFLLEEELLRHGDLTKLRNQIHESYSAQADQIEREYDVLLTKILQGETEINGVKFSSAEQAMKYADMVRDYKVAQLEVEREKEIQMATELAYEKGIISKAEYEQYIQDSQDRLEVSQNEVDSLVRLIEEGAEGVSYAWEATWEAIKLAEQQGIPASLIRNKEFTDAVAEYFEQGGTDMQEAITTAYDEITNTTESSRIAIEGELNKLDTSTKKNMDNVITYMNDMGLSLEDACALYGIDTNLMIGYIRQLATGIQGSSIDIRDEFIENTTSSKTMTGAVAKNFESMNTRVMGALVEMDGSLIVTDNTMQNTGKTARNALPIVASSAEQMGTRVRSALVDTQGNFISTNGVVARQVSGMQNKINGIKGKSVDVTVNFKTINYASTIAKMQQAKTHVYSAVLGGYKDALTPIFNFGENYMEDLYGLKDAGIKTISLAHLEDGISAYATKDSEASSIVNNSVANYNYNGAQSVAQEVSIPNSLLRQRQYENENEKTIEININIENMNGNQQDLDKLIKMIDERVKMKSKRW